MRSEKLTETFSLLQQRPIILIAILKPVNVSGSITDI
jgi:hypothetical protein